MNETNIPSELIEPSLTDADMAQVPIDHIAREALNGLDNIMRVYYPLTGDFESLQLKDGRIDLDTMVETAKLALTASYKISESDRQSMMVAYQCLVAIQGAELEAKHGLR